MPPEPSVNLHSRFQSTFSLYHDAPTSLIMNHDDIKGLNDFNAPQGSLQPLENQVAQQQLRLAAMEDMLSRMSQTLERLALLSVSTPLTTPFPPSPPPSSQPLPQTRSAKVSPPGMFTGD